MRDGFVCATGATGFVGRALVAELLARGVAPERLRLLVRDPDRAVACGLPRASLVPGDLSDMGALEKATSGAATVFHVAGATRALSVAGFLSANKAGTEALIRAVGAVAPGCRLVHVSSLAAAGPSLHGETSALPARDCRPRSAYGESKRQGELAVEAAGDAVSWIILRPGVVYGPHDEATRLLFRQALAPVVPVPFTRRLLSVMHVRDLVQALLLAATSDCGRRAIPVGGPNILDTDSIMSGLAQACGRRARLLRVPLLTVWPAALACDLWSGLRRRAHYFGRDKLRDVRAPGWVADLVPARETLGFVPRIASTEGFRETAEAEGFVG